MIDIAPLATKYRDFTVLQKATPFSELYKDIDISKVPVHSLQISNPESGIVGFCGWFKWINNELIPGDGDSYNPKMEVIAYKKYRLDGEDRIAIIVGDDW